MDSNYLVQRRINAQKKFRRKVTLTIVLSVILVILIIVGLVKVIMDDNKDAANTQKNDTEVSQNNSPVENVENVADEGLKNNDTEPSETVPEITVVPQASATPTPTVVPALKVAIDAGHGGEDLGSTREGLYEKDANLAISLYLKEILEEAGYATYMVRDTDMTVENTTRPAAAIENEADIYVSIHLNSLESDSDSTQGTEVWYADMRNDQSDVLAQYVVDELTKVIDTRNRGIKLSNNLIVLKYNEMPACLVECGFITSPTERAKLFDPEYQKDVAKGIANGIMKFLPLE